jgi:hypothetical protein
MPLSEHERHVLDEMEHELGPFDGERPRAGGARGVRDRRGAVMLLQLLGLSLLTYGLVADNGVGIAAAVSGFALIVGALDAAVTARRQRRRAQVRQAGPSERILRLLPLQRRLGPGPNLS